MKKLLIIEDNNAIASVIDRIANSLGYLVTIAHSFSEVKDLLASQPDFFIATVDYCLPDAYDGQVIPYVLEHNIPSIIMTGRMDDDIHRKLLKLPIIDYITKENAQAYHYLLKVLHFQLTNHKIGVLVVDDSLSARQYICRLLKRRNFTVYDAPDATKAMQVLDEIPSIKLLITDQEMPGISGLELIQMIRKKYLKRDLVIIGCSGMDSSFQSVRFIKSGANDFLKKPFCPEEFYCRVLKSVEELQYIEQVKTIANSDYLTPLANHRAFIEKTNHEFTRLMADTLNYIFVILQIDHFKAINEQYGHDGGDQVLVDLANLLTSHFSGQSLARLGGGRFCCLVSGDEFSQIDANFSAFKTLVSQHTTSYQEQIIKFTISLGGIAVEPKSTVKQWFDQAEQALQQAQGDNGNHIVIKGIAEILS